MIAGPGAPGTAAAGFTDAKRELRSLTATLEKRALLWLAARMPPWVGSDHLTALGLAAMAAAGVFYALSGARPAFLHLVNVCLALNWFGDSLDGTLARFRNRSRPRYGFYVDHMVDAYGALCVMAGLGWSGYMSPEVAVAILVAYYLLNIHIFLAAYTLGVFKIAYGRFGGTELRIVIALLNLLVLYRPRIVLGGGEYRTLDLCGVAAAVGITIALAIATARATRTLYVQERLPD